MDGLLWAGKTIVKDDPKLQNQNGKYIEKFLKLNDHLTVVNALPLCTGNITKRRCTKKGTQESILDFFVVCDKLLPLVTHMTIDETGYNSLTRYKGTCVKSDHMKIEMEANLIFHKEEKHERLIVFNVKNKKCQQQFFEYTSKTTMFTKCFESKEDGINANFAKWQTKFQKSLYACFKKVRVKQSDNKTSKIDDLMNQKKIILKKKNITNKDKKYN